jgi:hypothetical protein
MGYVGKNSSGGRTDYMDTDGNVWLSFHIAEDNLYYLMEPTTLVANAAS